MRAMFGEQARKFLGGPMEKSRLNLTQDEGLKAWEIYYHLVDLLKEASNDASEDDTVSERIYNRVFEIFQKGV